MVKKIITMSVVVAFVLFLAPTPIHVVASTTSTERSGGCIQTATDAYRAALSVANTTRTLAIQFANAVYASSTLSAKGIVDNKVKTATLRMAQKVFQGAKRAADKNLQVTKRSAKDQYMKDINACHVVQKNTITKPPSSTQVMPQIAIPVVPAPIPAAKNFILHTNDTSADLTAITILKGTPVSITFNVDAEGTYHGGLDFRSPTITTGAISPGNSKTISFIADTSFAFIPYWPATNIQKQYVISITVQ